MSATQSLSQRAIMRRHPCFDEGAHERVGRVHLAVARRCNIRCAFCERRVCANLTMQHPGWAQRLLRPEEAVALVRRLVHDHTGSISPSPLQRGRGRGMGYAPGNQGRSQDTRGLSAPEPTGGEGCHLPQSFVVGVAGPGEPLANEETFEALEAVHREFPALLKCVSTNGLLLEESLSRLVEAGVRALTVTVNAPDGEVGRQVCAWARYRGTVYQGQEAAELLLARQMAGLRAALAAGLAVKVNTVLIPGVNDRHVARLARDLRDLGIPLMNLMPLIPGGRLAGHRAPTCAELRQARLECEAAVPQFRRCEHCRADAVRLPRSRS